MDDLGVPLLPPSGYTPGYPPATAPSNPYGFSQRAPTSYTQPVAAPPPAHPMNYISAPPPQMVPIGIASAPPQITVLMLRDGNRRLAGDYWFEGDTQLRYVGRNGVPVVIPMELFDLPATVEVNRRRGVAFTARSAAY